MSGTVLIALLSFAGTAVGTLGGIVASSRLINYRLEQLEKKVDAHNDFILKIPVFEEQIKAMNQRVSDIEKEDAPYENFKGNHCPDDHVAYRSN